MTYDYNSNIIIDKNNIDHGIYSNGSTSTVYVYDQHAWVYGSALITGNSFYNPKTSTDILNITNGSCIVRNNKFFRGSTIVNSYIRTRYTDAYQYSGVDEITDNIFDSWNIGDGYTTELVTGLNPGTVYTRNRNQTGKTYIPIYADSMSSILSSPTATPIIQEYEIALAGNSGDHSIQIRRAPESAFGRPAQANMATSFHSASDATVFPLNFVRSFDAQMYLDKGATIIEVNVGGICSDSATVASYGDSVFFGVRLNYLDPALSMNVDQNSSGFLSAPTLQQDYLYQIERIDDLANLQVTTQFVNQGSLATTFPNGDYYGFVYPDFRRVGNGYHIEIQFRVNIPFSSTYFINFTPIEVTYRF